MRHNSIKRDHKDKEYIIRKMRICLDALDAIADQQCYCSCVAKDALEILHEANNEVLNEHQKTS